MSICLKFSTFRFQRAGVRRSKQLRLVCVCGFFTEPLRFTTLTCIPGVIYYNDARFSMTETSFVQR